MINYGEPDDLLWWTWWLIMVNLMIYYGEPGD